MEAFVSPVEFPTQHVLPSGEEHQHQPQDTLAAGCLRPCSLHECAGGEWGVGSVKL